MIEEKTKEPQSQAPAAPVKGREKLRSFWAKVQISGLLRRHRFRRKTQRHMNDVAKKLRASAVVLAVGEALYALGFAAELHCDSHANLLQYVQPGTVDAVMFNFGWLPGADHGVFSHAQSSIPALEAALEALRPGGVLSAILYSGKVIGSDEKTEILQWMRSRPLKQCTALVCGFANWADTAPLPCFLLKK